MYIQCYASTDCLSAWEVMGSFRGDQASQEVIFFFSPGVPVSSPHRQHVTTATGRAWSFLHTKMKEGGLFVRKSCLNKGKQDPGFYF